MVSEYCNHVLAKYISWLFPIELKESRNWLADREKSHETSCKNKAVFYRKNSRTGLLKVSCDKFLALSYCETSFMKPNLMRLVRRVTRT